MKELPLDNDYEAEVALTRKNADTGLDEAATGLTGLSFRISATKGGAAIHSSLSVDATERAQAPGVYSAILQGNDLRTQLATAYIGKTVYEVFGDGVNVFTSSPRRVVASRQP